MGLSNELSPVRLGVSPAAASTSTGVFSQRFEALFPHAGALGCLVCGRAHQLLPHCQLQPCPPRSTIHHLTGSTSRCRLSTQLRVSIPPTHLDECVFFNSLVVGLPYSLIFCQFSLFFVFKFLLSFSWFLRGGSMSTYTSILAGSLCFIEIESNTLFHLL